MPKYNISVNKLKQQGAVTRRTLATSTTSYQFTFNILRKRFERRYSRILSFSNSNQGTHRVLTCGIYKSNYNRFWTENLHAPVHSAISLASFTFKDVFSGLGVDQRQLNAGFPSTLHTIHQSLNQLCHVTTMLLEIPLCLTVHLNFLNSPVMVIQDDRQDTYAILLAFSPYDAVTFTNQCYSKLWDFQTKNAWRLKSSMMT